MSTLEASNAESAKSIGFLFWDAQIFVYLQLFMNFSQMTSLRATDYESALSKDKWKEN